MNTVSANSSVLNCSGTTCTAGNVTNTSNVNVTVNVSDSDVTAVGWVNTNEGSVCPDGTYSGSNCGGSNINENHKMMLYRGNGDSPLTIASYSPVWTITVVAPSTLPGGSGDGGNGGGGGGSPTALKATCAVGADGFNVTWNSVAQGGTGGYTYLWTGTDGLNSNLNPVNKTYTTTGLKTATVKVDSGTQSTSTSCSVSIGTAAKCGTNEKDYDSMITEWPGTFCESGDVFEVPAIPEYGGLVEWVCVKTNAATEAEKTDQCTANIVGPKILSAANCTVSQANDAPNIPVSGSIYSNRTAQLKTTNADYNGYNFAWFDTTGSGSQQIGTGKTASTIFRTIGNKKIKLSIYKTGELGAVCTTSVKVIQKPADVIEQ
jgi:hypothetical protein